MKYIKLFEAEKKKFCAGMLVTPLKDTKYASSNKAYKISGEYSPEYCVVVLKYNGWAYSLETDYEYDTNIFRETDLRVPTLEEYEEYSIRNDANKYNI